MIKKNYFKDLIVTIVFFILIISCQGYRMTNASSLNINAGKDISEFDFNEVNLSSYRDSISKEMNRKLNYSIINMDVGCPEGLLGDFISDLSILYIKKSIQNIKFEPDFCILNNGGFRNMISKGPVTVNDIYQLMPFDNYLVILEIQGEQLSSLFNYIKNKSISNINRKSGVPLSGIRMKISGDNITRCMVNNRTLNPLKKYKVLTTNYLANGGDQMDFFKECNLILNTEFLLRDVIINYIEELGKSNIQINAQLDGRVQVLQ
mgnify:FL=1